MTSFIRKHTILLAIAAALLSGILVSGCVSLAGDVTPPPNYVAPTDAPPEQPKEVKTVFPLVPPDPAQGAAIFAQKCAPCHGDGGLGDGAQSANLPNPAAPIGKPDFARMSRPVDWFEIVTNGNLQKYMPGFAESLTDRQRWDVVAYAYTLSTSNELLTAGKTVYDQDCAECHGATGKGDGTKAASLSTKPTSWLDQSKLVLLSSDEIVSILQNGQGDMPAYKGKLDETQSYAVADYIRSLSFSGKPDQNASANAAASAETAVATPGTGTPAAGETPAAAGTPNAIGDKVTISGAVTNGTPGGKLPAAMKVTLLAFSGMNPAFNNTVDVGVDGKYEFKDVKFDPSFVYMVQADANGLTFNSDILHGSDFTTQQASLPIQIYDSTTDPAALKVDRLHVFFDFSKPGVVQVVNLFLVSNTSDRVVAAADKSKPVITFELPKGYTNLQFQDGKLGDGHYLETPNGFGDTSAVAPGANAQTQILFAYEMPYTNKLDLSVKTPLATDAVVVMAPPGVKVKGSQLVEQGQRDVQGVSFEMYQALGALPANGELAISLSGKAGDAAASSSNQDNFNYILIGLGAFGAVLVGVGIWLWMRRRHMEPALAGAEAGDGSLDAAEGAESESSEALLDAIMALDDLHASGKLPEAAYQERRAEIKARLAEALQREKGK